MLTITIKQGKETSLKAGNPWIYLSAIERVDGKFHERIKSGATCLVRSSKGEFLARAGWSPKSQIRARVWTFDEHEAVDHAMFKRRIHIALHKNLPLQNTAGKPQRLVNGEEDGLPGLVVEFHALGAGFLSCQFQAAGVDAWKVPIVKALISETGCQNVYERTDYLIRQGEGLSGGTGVLAGDAPPTNLSASISKSS
ncbi:SAM-dependent methyltransferase [Undibacterium fentianense]|uniref:SAM-dependent methyltransferase n=1 Tax=Undibacterium fentianense TaxID=2828728 RepID=A0A941IGR3_9BURK|nr:SAM-dependent methyltransferase [Undibacterium fentianense]MBR7800265.1 SAM-dependent methyltransferase [Undibacterium fentianense]